MNDKSALQTKRKYVPNPNRTVAAVRIPDESSGLVYTKWGGQQQAKPGDWLVDSGDEVYTVDADVFANTYVAVDRDKSPGSYRKTAPVWAVEATEAGTIQTKEGMTAYEKGDFIVSNDADGSDSYAMSPARFFERYVAADE